MIVRTLLPRAYRLFLWRIRLHLYLPLILTATACSEPERKSDNGNLGRLEADQAPIGQIPAIAETRSYRCKGDSILYVDYFQNGTGAILRTRDGLRTRFIATTIGGPFISRDQTLERGDGDIVLTRSGTMTQTCGASK